MEVGTLALDLWRKRESKIVGVCFRRELWRKWRENNLEMLQRPQNSSFLIWRGREAFHTFLGNIQLAHTSGIMGTHTMCVNSSVFATF